MFDILTIKRYIQLINISQNHMTDVASFVTFILGVNMLGIRKMVGLSCALVFGVNTSIYASELKVVLPKCLATQVNFDVERLAKTDAYELMGLDRDYIEDLAKLKQKVHCGGFVDVTRKFNQTKKLNKNAQSFLQHFVDKPHFTDSHETYHIKHQAVVNSMLENVKSEVVWDTLTDLTRFSDRSASTETGVQAAEWIKDNFDKMANDAGRTDVKSYLVDTGWWYSQPSVVTVVGTHLDNDAVVVGAHMDTLSYDKPGADDDGSGSASITEAARVILNSKEKLSHPVYFIWYAAEEEGLVGSGYVVEDFLSKHIPVKAVIHFDMTGYRYHNKETMWLLDDNTNKSLTSFVDSLIKEYVGVKVGHTTCGYQCSDHASWNNEGIKAAAPFEAKFGEEDPYIHTGRDTMDYVSLNHMTNFTKLAIAFVGELAS